MVTVDNIRDSHEYLSGIKNENNNNRTHQAVVDAGRLLEAISLRFTRGQYRLRPRAASSLGRISPRSITTPTNLRSPRIHFSL